MNIFFAHKFKMILGLAVLFIVMAGVFIQSSRPVASQEQAPDVAQKESSPWFFRCNEPNIEIQKGSCEIVQNLLVAETKERVVEFAVGFPKDKKDARGVLVLPLGVLLTEGTQMKIDDGTPFKFDVRYCTREGCYAFLNMNDKLLNVMRKGNKMTILFKASSGEEGSIVLSLSGFKKALEKVS